MQRIFKERDRLLRKAARADGLIWSLAAVLCMVVPGGISTEALIWCAPLTIALAVSQYMLGRTGAIRWVLLIGLSGLSLILVVGLVSHAGQRLNMVELCVIALVAAGAMSCVVPVLVINTQRMIILGAMLGVTAATVLAITLTFGDSATPFILTLCVWLATAAGGWWLSQSIPRAMQRIAAIGRAHRAERHASELEAQRRQDARLLHDTVLATLTLLAHSGVGVSPTALQQQAGDDARLLRQLRLGGLPMPRTSGVYTLEPATEFTLGNTLESVKQRFGRIGLDVDWHGSGQVLLPTEVLDSFLLALGECLENVRRHSGVTRADVTITDDEKTVRAMVTDSGIGFDLGEVGAERLGLAESVVARLRDVGGNARLFSSPGSGTTVVLEVPK